MAEVADVEKVPVMSTWQRYKTKIMIGAGTVAMAAPALAGDINDSVSPILEDVAALFSPLLTLVIAALPVIIALAVVGFILGLFDGILSKIKI